MPSLDTSIANAGPPTLARAFDASFQQVQWIVLAYLLTITTMIVSAGRLGDLIGLSTLTSLLCGLAPTLWLLVAARAVQGLGAAIILALTLFSDAMAMTTATGGGGPMRMTWLFGANLLMSALIATIMMATLVVGPFYLSRSRHIETAFVGLVLSIGPLVVVLTGVPAGRLVDRFGTPCIVVAGLVSVITGCLALAALPSRVGLVGYHVPHDDPPIGSARNDVRSAQPGAVARQTTPATMHSAPVMRLHPAGSLSKRLPK